MIGQLTRTARGLFADGVNLRKNATTKEEAERAKAYFQLSEKNYDMAISCLIRERDEALKEIEHNT